MAEMLVKDLQKLREHFFPTIDHLMPAPDTMEFYCVICNCFKTGSAKASLEIGGWCCAYHQTSANMKYD